MRVGKHNEAGGGWSQGSLWMVICMRETFKGSKHPFQVLHQGYNIIIIKQLQNNKKSTFP